MDLNGDNYYNLLRSSHLKDDWSWIDISPDTTTPDNTTNSTNNTDPTNSTDSTSETGGTKGYQVVLKPLYFIDFMTGFLVGANITGTGDELTVCKDTLTGEIIGSGLEIT